jgi:hypothetical protein
MVNTNQEETILSWRSAEEIGQILCDKCEVLDTRLTKLHETWLDMPLAAHDEELRKKAFPKKLRFKDAS